MPASKGGEFKSLVNIYLPYPRENQTKLDIATLEVSEHRMQNRTSKSLFCTRPLTAYYCPGRPGHQHYATTSQARYCFAAGTRHDSTSCSYVIFGFPLALCARRVSSIASRLPGSNRLGFQPSLAVSGGRAVPVANGVGSTANTRK